jgi:NAD+ kinase
MRIYDLMPAMKSIFKNIALIGKFMNSETSEQVEHPCCFSARASDQCGDRGEHRKQSMLADYPTAPIAQIGRDVDLAIVLGGDGTMLTAARAFVDYDTPLIGVNRGRFGFLTDLAAENPCWRASADILEGKFYQEERMLLTASLERDGKLLSQGHALNDVVVNKNGACQADRA